MPKTPFKIDTMAFSVRLPLELADWVNEQAARTGSFNQAIREALDDARTLYGLPDVLVEQLDAEAKDLSKSRRDYIVHLLAMRAAELLKAGGMKPPKDKKPR